jgi:DNA-binding MarR family transcriptional regulator
MKGVPQLHPSPEGGITNIGPIDTVFGFHLQRASFVFAPNLQSAPGIPRWELVILSVVSANPGIRQTSVSQTLGIDQGNLIPQLNRLIKLGLLTRVVPADDRRVRCLKLTSAGEGRLTKLMSLVKKLEAERLLGLSEPDRKQLLDLLRRVHSPRGTSNPIVARALRRGVNAR